MALTIVCCGLVLPAFSRPVLQAEYCSIGTNRIRQATACGFDTARTNFLRPPEYFLSNPYLWLFDPFPVFTKLRISCLGASLLSLFHAIIFKDAWRARLHSCENEHFSKVMHNLMEISKINGSDMATKLTIRLWKRQLDFSLINRSVVLYIGFNKIISLMYL
jgi:hypothetical protein